MDEKEEAYQTIQQKGVLITLRGIFKNVLLNFQWSDDINENRKKLLEEFNIICNCFIDGGLIHDFSNVSNNTNNPSQIQNGMSVMDTFIKFVNDGSTHILTSVVQTSVDIKITEDVDSVKPNQYWNRVKDLLEKITLNSSEKLKYLNEQKEEVRQRKMFHITRQQFEPAAEWRDIERTLTEMLETEKQKINVWNSPLEDKKEDPK
jgi:hypothetical protein